MIRLPRLVFASGNPGKLREFRRLLTPLGLFTSVVGAQVGHTQLDTSGEALLFPARTRKAAVYFFN